MRQANSGRKALAEGLERRELLSAAVAAFGAQQTFGVGLVPQVVAVADLNRDGKLDLVTANQGDDTASVLLGNGNGTFGAQQTFATGSLVSSVAVADVNGDGKLDLAVANLAVNSAGVLLGNGDGTFQAQKTFAAGDYPRSVATSDVNGDGKVDLILANYFGDNVSVLLGNGNGTFQSQKLFATKDEPTSVTTADVNGDGKIDLAVTNRYANSVSVMLGNGNGTFVFQKTFGTGSDPISIATGDFNGDGKPDLVTSNYVANTVSVLLGNGNGTFLPSKTYVTDTAPGAVTVGDVNVDGKADLAVANSSGDDLSVLIGNGDGTFKTQRSFATDSGPASIAIADFNVDGRPDLVTANSVSGDVSVLLGDAPPVVTGINRQTAGPITSGSNLGWVVTFSEPVTGVDESDFVLVINGAVAGAPDAVGQLNGSLYIVSKSGLTSSGGTVGLKLVDDGSIKDAVGNGLAPAGVGFGARQTFGAGTLFLESVTMADVNADSIPDALVSLGDRSAVAVLLGNGDGSFKTQTSFGTDLHPISVAVSDVNGDGRADLVVANYGEYPLGHTVSVLLGNGNGTFGAQTTFAVGNRPRYAVVADMNLDGRPDIVSANENDKTLSVLLGNGNGTFQNQRTFGGGAFMTSIATFDANGDGKPDVVASNNGSSSVSVLLGNGDGTLQTQRTFATGANPWSLTTADVNGDGKTDLVVANRSSYSAGVLLGNGDGTFLPQQTFAAGFGPDSVVVADMNLDGKADLVVANVSGTVSVLPGNGDGTFAGQQTLDAGSGLSSVAVSDVNRDGRPDVVAANFNSGAISVLLADSSGSFMGQTYVLATKSDTITGTAGVDQITLAQDPDHTHIDWTMGSTVGQIAVNDPNGLTIFGNGGHDVINLDYSNGNPLPNLLKIKQPQGGVPSVNDVTVNGLTGTNAFSNTTLDINTSKVFLNYGSAANDAAVFALIKQYLTTGYNANTWTGVAPAGGGSIRSSAAALNANLFAVGFADSSAVASPNTSPNTIEVMYTIKGDATLDGRVNLSDLNALGANVNASPASWNQGNFNYDAFVNLTDLNILGSNVNQVLPAGGPAVATAVTAAWVPAAVGPDSVVVNLNRSGSGADVVRFGGVVPVDQDLGLGHSIMAKKKRRR